MTSNEYLTGFVGLGRLLDSGGGLPVIGPRLEAQVASDPLNANALLDLSTLIFFTANPDMRKFAVDYQQRALQLRQVYVLPPPRRPAPLRLLVIMAPGDMTSNTPVDCLLEGADVHVTLLYVLPDCPLPSPLPEHDLVFVAIGESSANQVLLRQLGDLPKFSVKPLLNAPERIARLTRDRVSELLESLPGAVMPATILVDRRRLLDVQRLQLSLDELMEGGQFPIIVRPVDSQGGKDLAKVDALQDLSSYLAKVPNDEFYISNFIDYRSQDGQFRKYRVVLVAGRPFACHLAISSNWMIHYVNADMDASAAKRNEEEHFFATFEQNFAKRHEPSLRSINELVGLNYLAIDCAETPDGKLLVFEVDNAAIVHAFDDPKLYPYKRPAMEKIFEAFREMLLARATVAGRVPASADKSIDGRRK